LEIKQFFIENSFEERVDRYLSQALDVSRNQIEQLIRGGNVKLNGKVIKKGGVKLKNSSTLEVYFPTPQKSDALYPVDFDIPILYEDNYLMVLNKPPNIVVHPAPSVKEATLVDWLKERNFSLSNLNGDERHGIVHRLDKGTTGAILIAKDNKTHSLLSQQLKDRTMGRYYLAIIDNPLKSDNIIVEAPIGRNPNNRLKMGVVENGRYAKTLFKKITSSENSSYELIGAKLWTGRTHQIRVHLSTLGRHIIGDNLYGFKSKKVNIDNVLLHAHTIYFRHPISGDTIYVDAKIDRGMLDFINKYFALELQNEKIDNFHTIFNSFDV